jgi:hypothetical protein
MELLDICLATFRVMILQVALNYIKLQLMIDHKLPPSKHTVRHNWVKLIRGGNCVFI